jgi:hypothetical protein
MNQLNGTNILLIAPPFFDYSQEISDALARRGAVVDSLPDRPFEAPALKALTRLNKNLITPFADRFYQEAFERIGNQNYRYVLVIIGETLSEKIYKHMRTQFPNAQFILYMWDSFKNRKSLYKNLANFDRALTFDLEDSRKYGLLFRPLFFSDAFKPSKKSHAVYDISFIGTAHSDRYRIVNSVKTGLGQDTRNYFYLYLQAAWVFYAHKLGNPAFKNAQISDFKFIPLNKTTVRDIFLQSNVILDIEHPQQTGLTMRTFETLGSQKKLITTNKAVKNYDFYCSHNVHIIDRERPAAISKEFLSASYQPIHQSLYEKYSMDGWLNEVFNLNSPKPFK